MLSEQPLPTILTGTDSTAELIRSWLIDEKQTRSGLIGVDRSLQIVTVQTFQHSMSQPAINSALGEALHASTSGVIAYNVAEPGRPLFDPIFTRKLAAACEAINSTLLDVMVYSPDVPKGWLSARQQGII